MQVTGISREEIVKDGGEDKSVDIEMILREEWDKYGNLKFRPRDSRV